MRRLEAAGVPAERYRELLTEKLRLAQELEVAKFDLKELRAFVDATASIANDLEASKTLIQKIYAAVGGHIVALPGGERRSLSLPESAIEAKRLIEEHNRKEG